MVLAQSHSIWYQFFTKTVFLQYAKEIPWAAKEQSPPLCIS